MTTELDWSHDFCLSCDRQIAEGAYCSQACRLADLEKAGTSEPQTPMNFSSSAASYASSSAGFYLPPAVNFAAYKSTSTRLDSAPTSPSYYSTSTTLSSYFHTPASTGYASASPPKRSLSPSSSRSSLSSITSTQPTQGLSAQAAHELKGYVSAFDQTRDRKRRQTHH
ncbi:uncharacterized protein BDZ99DRAFT_33104 [Mytilinidion resinicola]|uniref:Life-span regulatory factor n=1 Tax=Mytilinidion resinicola TaxID=574789 RepID=A0A6A6YM52_9PEZI|nr:uncharacterized protein BDZ99DRAFT_33104 [Mytilinidion resinicola]KAF2809629.1 hypothetical protein BDZ99DRAFT_33104 [Mytilinidion resinicola]